jgi:hypothetical protein
VRVGVMRCLWRVEVYDDYLQLEFSLEWQQFRTEHTGG